VRHFVDVERNGGHDYLSATLRASAHPDAGTPAPQLRRRTVA
jgi:hypothetical protein